MAYQYIKSRAANRIVLGMKGIIASKTVGYDFARLMDDAKLLSCSAFGEVVIEQMPRKT